MIDKLTTNLPFIEPQVFTPLIEPQPLKLQIWDPMTIIRIEEAVYSMRYFRDPGQFQKLEMLVPTEVTDLLFDIYKRRAVVVDLTREGHKFVVEVQIDNLTRQEQTFHHVFKASHWRTPGCLEGMEPFMKKYSCLVLPVISKDTHNLIHQLPCEIFESVNDMITQQHISMLNHSYNIIRERLKSNPKLRSYVEPNLLNLIQLANQSVSEVGRTTFKEFETAEA